MKPTESAARASLLERPFTVSVPAVAAHAVAHRRAVERYRGPGGPVGCAAHRRRTVRWQAPRTGRAQ